MIVNDILEMFVLKGYYLSVVSDKVLYLGSLDKLYFMEEKEMPYVFKRCLVCPIVALDVKKYKVDLEHNTVQITV